MSIVRIGILGYAGRMGKLIAQEIAENPACTLSGGAVLASEAGIPAPKGAVLSTKASEVIAVSDAVIDFTSADAVAAHAQEAATHNKPYMSGVTGLSSQTLDAFKLVAKKIPLLYAPNTSLSLAAMKQVVALAAKLLANFDYDISILDQHHRMKKDAPSGTALALGEAVLRGNEGKKKPEYAAIRAGSIVGEHDVIFAGQGEIIRLQHSVTERRIFARGAVQAALWLHNKKPGFYSMDDVLDLKSAV